MNCPKCKSEGQNGNFCSNCGEKLKERCRECGQIERIGRKICDKKIRQIEEEIADYQNKNSRNYSSIGMNIALIVCVLCIMLIFASLAFPINIERKMTKTIVSVVFLGALASMVAGQILHKCKRKQTKQKFLQLRPDYAEILKKTEGD